MVSHVAEVATKKIEVKRLKRMDREMGHPPRLGWLKWSAAQGG